MTDWEDAKLYTSRNQNKAADPQNSAWVSANAGAGKTNVLINRVIRFLLAGTLPERILCLTFTKAAAAEMTDRLYKRLSYWAVCAEAQLRADMTALLERAPQQKEIIAARRLFAAALETPGGLKIQTIHAFCESLLHRFPIEADVPAGFEVLDETGQREILNHARRQVLDKAGLGGDKTLSRALGQIIAYTEQTGFDKLLNDILDARGKLASFVRAFNGLEEGFATLAQTLGLKPKEDETSLFEEMTGPDHFDSKTLDAAADGLRTSSGANDQKAGVQIKAVLESKNLTEKSLLYLDLFFTSGIYSPSRKPRAKLASKGFSEAHSALFDFLEDEQTRLIPLYERLKAYHLLQATTALLRIADDIIDRFVAEKNRLGMLDYDDLIENVISLFTRSGAAWVLYKLDGGLDHILIDEAQDTSPEQWQVVRYLSEEFFAGEGVRDVERTIFAVGDEKQSIYSFQGADPAEFEAMRRHFANKSKQAEKGFAKVELTVSFRSTQTVLWAVDEVFSGERARIGLSATDMVESHQAYRIDAPGLIEIWPTEKPGDKPENNPWNAPLDWENPQSPRSRLAEKIADQIADWLNPKAELTSLGRPIVADDILVLVRRRDRFVDALVRALKQRNVPVAGADRMKLANQIAIIDLIALAQAALLPQDDLTLASVLKSPLIGLDEDELFELAYDRKGSLWRQLREAGKSQKHYGEIYQKLVSWFNLADYGTVFDFFSAVLTSGQGRKHIVDRLGTEAHDPLDAFLDLILQFEQRNPASLQGFLAWFEASTSDIKRDLSHGSGEVRIMTVHGAKGLEANIVFLPDSCAVPDSGQDAHLLFLNPDGHEHGVAGLPVWRLKKGYETQEIAKARDQIQLARTQEYHRLLYVAMTRARDWLFVCGYEGKNKRPEGCWYDLMFDALEPHLDEIKNDEGDIVRWQKISKTSSPEKPAKPEKSTTLKSLPPWIDSPAPKEAAPQTILAPSRLILDETSVNNLAENSLVQTSLIKTRLNQHNGFKRGLIIHKLLQYLPDLNPDARQAAANNYLSRPEHGLSLEERQTLLSETMAVLNNPDFAALFQPGSKAEIPIAGWVTLKRKNDEKKSTPQPVSGQIDRLAIEKDTVFIVDYKTDRNVPENANLVGQNYINQLATYRAVISELYPDKKIRCILLWTLTPIFMEIPNSILDKALTGT